ncbi:glycoside hydrolase family 9 domain protein [Teredinibacter turnerae T7901]|uniref:Glycoside hydrolase family 9 domain protein n=1 Tax=Teredinibacter turnerae (strain ATCC 39867 / T7901) TaxID=377629 RepID=C5BPG8_TERTT|nr:glycoside hydrolase family 9 protein [Teredinibacter turnerae]ACR12726.1 glycoside hydrolase family 9 domain protein [Teredinibacter turnerae T7901]
MSVLRAVLLCSILLSGAALAKPAQLTLNDSDYFEAQGLNVLVFSNWYNGLFDDSKISGVEIIHHGVRTVTNGDVRLHSTPEQWDKIPAFIERKVDRETGTIEAFLHYPDYEFNYSIRVQSTGDGVQIAVNLPKAVPEALAGKAGFNLEFIPSAYFEKGFLIDGKPGAFPVYPSGRRELDYRAPRALAKGHNLVLGAGDAERQISIASEGLELALYDGRGKAQNGWFVVRSVLPAGKTGDVLTWKLSANVEKNWLRTPVIGHSQLGYHPSQQKVAVLELDKNDRSNDKVSLVRINNDGSTKVVAKGRAEPWGSYKRYNYRTFDFSKVTATGLYKLQYGKVETAPFMIAEDVYKNAWHPSLDVYMPVQMDHMLINEAYRVWHGASHLDDALQAPVDHKHFDLYAQGPTTDTPYKPGEHIPGLNVGGWYDAGDYDIRTQTQYRTVEKLVDAWETFQPKRDVTLVDYPRKYVDLHVPDGKLDILQQVEHGAIALLAQFDAVGHAIPGIIVPTLAQYTHLGDGLTMTDNMVYNPKMGELENNGKQSGVFDDRWAFTSESSKLNYGSVSGLAAASRALKGHNDTLAKACLDTALKAWRKEQNREPVVFDFGNTTGGPLESERFAAAVQLLLTSGGQQEFLDVVQASLPAMGEKFLFAVNHIMAAYPYMDDAHKQQVRAMAETYAAEMRAKLDANPYGVTITEGGWAGNGWVMLEAMSHYKLLKAFPDLFSKEDVYRGMNYLLGTHPDSDRSFVSGVGTVSKNVAYGMNRANFSFISGGVVPGVLILKPDLPENREDWPFFWGQNEYVVNMAAYFVYFALAVDDLATAQ